jgi:hypothetical protein
MNGLSVIYSRCAGVTILLALLCVTVSIRRSDALDRLATEPGIRYGRTASGYAYMNGGASDLGQSMIERQGGAYNIKLVMVPPPAIALPRFRIYLANNRTGKIENIPLSGPWLYFQLPAGSYTIGARIRNRIYILRDIHVQDTTRQVHILRADLLPWNPHQSNQRQGVK